MSSTVLPTAARTSASMRASVSQPCPPWSLSVRTPCLSQASAASAAMRAGLWRVTIQQTSTSRLPPQSAHSGMPFAAARSVQQALSTSALAKLGQNDVFERDRERARRIAGARGLDHALGDAGRAAVGDDLQQHIVAAVLGRVHPLDVPHIRQPVEMQRPFAELHAPYSERNGFFAPGQRNAPCARSTRMRTPLALFFAAVLAGCGITGLHRQDPAEPVAVVASPLEPAAQFEGGHASHDGAVVGAAGGAGLGAMSAYSSAGILCIIGGPVCMMVVVPVAVVGGLVGGVAGAAVDAVTTDPFGRIAGARAAIEQALADMRVTDGLASRTSEALKLPLAKAGELPGKTFLEVGVSDLQILAHEKEIALVLRGRSRLYRSVDGQVLEEQVAETRTDFRQYLDWAA